jgi:hypothetical protein
MNDPAKHRWDDDYWLQVQQIFDPNFEFYIYNDFAFFNCPQIMHWKHI